jgi:hypothetical protein
MAGDQSSPAPSKAAALYISSDRARAGRERGLRSRRPDLRTCIFVVLSVSCVLLYCTKMWLASLASVAASVGTLSLGVIAALTISSCIDPRHKGVRHGSGRSAIAYVAASARRESN